MARQKQTAKVKAEETVAADTDKEIEKGAETESEAGETAESAKTMPEQASSTAPEPAIETASNGDETKAQPAATQKSVNPNMRRFAVLKPVRFQGERIPRGRRATLTRAGHDELASLGAVSPVWDHGTPAEAA